MRASPMAITRAAATAVTVAVAVVGAAGVGAAQEPSGFDGGAPQVLSGELVKVGGGAPSSGGGALALTGAPSLLLLVLAVVLIVLGTFAWIISRRGLAGAEPSPEAFVGGGVTPDLRDAQGADPIDVLEAAIFELRSDIIGLRRAVLDWPELDHITSELVALRSELAEALRSGQVPGSSAGLGDLRATIEALRSEVGGSGVPSLAPLRRDIGELREEIAVLRRRISLRAGTGASSG